MPIEFRCVQCGKLLRTPDDTVGRQAQCPACGSLSEVPGASAAPLEPSPLGDVRPEQAASAGNPFNAAPPSGNVGDANPYRSALFADSAPQAAQRVAAPATALIVMAILGLVGQTLGVIVNGLQVIMGSGFGPQNDAIPVAFGGGINVMVGIIGIAVGVVVLLGALKMKRLENYSFAMTSAVVATIPCFSPCCLLGLPFGIWAIIVLNDPAVRNAFRS